MYNANYMDGVPVKIAEKYKPPPCIYKFPQNLANKLNLEENFYWKCPLFSCDLHLEKKALSKIEQWKRIRERNKEQRRERILKREQIRKREYEDRQKNLLYSVSYPSTDDLSSEEEGKGEVDIEHKKNNKGIAESNETATQICVTERVNSFDNILQPTILSFNSVTNSGIATAIKPTFDSKMSNSFNYKDFEDDTSSPFDNIELKTINDLDVLAQVLHNTQIKSSTNDKSNLNAADDTSSGNSNESPKTSNALCTQNKQFNTNSLVLTENIPKPNNNLPRFNHDLAHTRDTLVSDSAKHKDNLDPLSYSALHQCNKLNSSDGFYNYQTNNSNEIGIKTDSDYLHVYSGQHHLTIEQITKSKSVPDILKELRDEIRKSEMRRFRNCSHDIKDTYIDDSETNKSKTELSEADNGDIFSQLDGEAKQLVEQISGMGFPFKRVARIVQLVGTDDKKVVEHLIPLSELADLGFEEGKISDALLRNENNKNKALDDLIS